MFLTDKQIKDYQTDGVIIVKDIFKDWIKPLRKGFQKVLDNPSKHGRENVDINNGRFAVTPEFPGGTWAYYITLAEDNKPVYPYVFGPQTKQQRPS